jgi:GDP-L-fucose synthase
MGKALKKRKIFIAGHNGMVGSSILRHFKNLGLKKIITQSRKRLDLTNWNKVNKFLKKTRPDIVINCAGKVGGILANFTYPKEFLFENIYIQLNLLDACFKNKVKIFVNLGSSCIYPKKSKQPIKEDYLLSGKLEFTNEAYAIAKIVGLKSCEFYNRQFKTNYFTLMPCNLYGPNDNFNISSSHFVPGLIKKFYMANRKNMKNVEVWGTGRAKREIMYVDDLASAIFFILNKIDEKDKKVLDVLKKNSHINIGVNKEYTIKQFANMIGKLFNKKINLKFNKSYPDGTPRKLLDSSVMYSMGWKPIISIEKGLRKTLEWYKKNTK